MSIVRWNLKEAAGKTLRNHIEAIMLDEESNIFNNCFEFHGHARGYLQSKIYPESMFVDMVGISGKVSAHYPGRSALCLYSSYPRRMERTESRWKMR